MQDQIDIHMLGMIVTGRLQELDLDSFSVQVWGQLIAKAHSEGVAPLVYWTLSKSGKFSSIPEVAQNTLRAMYFATWMHNQKILLELEILARKFNQADISTVVLKGACFVLTDLSRYWASSDGGFGPVGAERKTSRGRSNRKNAWIYG